MSQSQVISFRVSGHFLNWIEAQKLDGESVNQAAQRILKEVSSVYGNDNLYTNSGNAVSANSPDLSTNSPDLSTPSSNSVVSTDIVDIVDKSISSQLDPVFDRITTIEERLGKLSA